MKARVEIEGSSDRAFRARDGIVAGAREMRSHGPRQAEATWVLVARGDETVEDFLLESPFGPDDDDNGGDPVAWICRSVTADGRLRLGTVDLEVDRFVSDVLNDQLREAILGSR